MRSIIPRPCTSAIRAIAAIVTLICALHAIGCAAPSQPRCTATMPARQLRPPPAPAPAPHPRVTRRPEQVELALLSAEGDGAWVFFAPESDLRPRIGECYRAALDKEPGVTGHMVFSVTRPLGGAASVELVTRSELPSVLVDCIEQVLETLQTSPDLALSPNVPPSHVYVSLY